MLNEKVICLTVREVASHAVVFRGVVLPSSPKTTAWEAIREGKKYNFVPELEAATLAGARVNFTDSAETFLVSKWSRIFQISFLTWTSKIQKIKLQTKELNKMADEELEKSIDEQKSVNTCRSTTPD